MAAPHRFARYPLSENISPTLPAAETNAAGRPLNIVGFPRYDRLGASSRLRFLNLMTPLSEWGVQVRNFPFFDNSYLHNLYQGKRNSPQAVASWYVRRALRLLALAARRDRPDVLWIEKECLPWLPLFLEQGVLRRFPYVLDFDDAWHLRYTGHNNLLIRRLLSAKLESLVANAALTVTGNDMLADWARQAGAHQVLKMPTPIDVRRYPLTPATRTDGSFRIGWIGTPSSAPHLSMIAQPLAQLAATGPAVLVSVGAAPLGLPGIQEEFHPWSETAEGAVLASLDVGVMPLIDTPFARGKSGYKLLQYMAAGKPVVASPVGENCAIIREDNGFLAATPLQWYAALDNLRRSPDLRQRLGANGRRLIEYNYDTTLLSRRLATALHGLRP